MTGARAKGKAYERRFGRDCASKLPGQFYANTWISFSDANGLGLAQPDFFLVREREIILFECKLTYTERAWPQMHKLYEPLLTRMFGLPCVCVQVCRNLTIGVQFPVSHDCEVFIPDSVLHYL